MYKGTTCYLIKLTQIETDFAKHRFKINSATRIITSQERCKLRRWLTNCITPAAFLTEQIILDLFSNNLAKHILRKKPDFVKSINQLFWFKEKVTDKMYARERSKTEVKRSVRWKFAKRQKICKVFSAQKTLWWNKIINFCSKFNKMNVSLFV